MKLIYIISNHITKHFQSP